MPYMNLLTILSCIYRVWNAVWFSLKFMNSVLSVRWPFFNHITLQAQISYSNHFNVGPRGQVINGISFNIDDEVAHLSVFLNLSREHYLFNEENKGL